MLQFRFHSLLSPQKIRAGVLNRNNHDKIDYQAFEAICASRSRTTRDFAVLKQKRGPGLSPALALDPVGLKSSLGSDCLGGIDPPAGHNLSFQNLQLVDRIQEELAQLVD